jgi:hypothetical protein
MTSDDIEPMMSSGMSYQVMLSLTGQQRAAPKPIVEIPGFIKQLLLLVDYIHDERRKCVTRF